MMDQAIFSLSGGWIVFLLVFSVIMAVIESFTQMRVALICGLCASIPLGFALFAQSLTASWSPIAIVGLFLGVAIASIPAVGVQEGC